MNDVELDDPDLAHNVPAYVLDRFREWVIFCGQFSSQPHSDASFCRDTPLMTFKRTQENLLALLGSMLPS